MIKSKYYLSALLSVFFLTLSTHNALALLGVNPYIDLNGGYAFSDSKTINGADNQKDSGFGYNINAGVMFMELVGIEAGFTQYPDVTYRYNGNDQSASLYGYDLALKGDAPLPLTGLSLVGKLGIGRLNQGSLNFSGSQISSEKGNNLYWAMGLKYDLSFGFYTQLLYQVNQGSSNIPSSSLLSLGLGFQL